MTPDTPTAGRREAEALAHVHARRYGNALLVADTGAAERAIDDALADGLSPTAIQSLVIAPAMVGVGELWEVNVCTVADEHVATAISQRVLVKLFDKLSVSRPRSRARILLAAVEGQQHVLGLRMAADVLEGHGYDVLYLGADVPVDALSRFAAEHQPAITGLAFSISLRVNMLAESIHAVHEACPQARIMLGGRAVPARLIEAGYVQVRNSMELLSIVDVLLREPSPPDPEVLQLLRGTRRERRQDRARASDSDPESVAERMADVAENATETARKYVRLAGAFKDLAFRDPVTDLGNRRAFDDRLGERETSDDDGALLMIDVDNFKAVNDTYGHDAGDRLLRHIGTAITQAVRAQDFAARVGGDEFAVLLPKASPDEGRAIGERVRQAISRNAYPPVTVSIGLARLTADSRGAVLAADEALYKAKGAGRDCVVDAATLTGSALWQTKSGPGRMYVSMSRLEIAPERAPELVAAFRDRSRLADDADGFLDLQVWQSDRDPGEILMVSRWRDRDAFKAYMKSEAHKLSHGRIDPDLKADITLRRLEHLHTYEVVAE